MIWFWMSTDLAHITEDLFKEDWESTFMLYKNVGKFLRKKQLPSITNICSSGSYEWNLAKNINKSTFSINFDFVILKRVLFSHS